MRGRPGWPIIVIYIIAHIYDGLDVSVTSNIAWFRLNHDMVSRRIDISYPSTEGAALHQATLNSRRCRSHDHQMMSNETSRIGKGIEDAAIRNKRK